MTALGSFARPSLRGHNSRQPHRGGRRRFLALRPPAYGCASAAPRRCPRDRLDRLVQSVARDLERDRPARLGEQEHRDRFRRAQRGVGDEDLAAGWSLAAASTARAQARGLQSPLGDRVISAVRPSCLRRRDGARSRRPDREGLRNRAPPGGRPGRSCASPCPACAGARTADPSRLGRCRRPAVRSR